MFLNSWLWMSVSLGNASYIQAFSEDFSAYEQAEFDGTAEWEAGWSADPWSAVSREWVYTTTDESGGSFGLDGAADNHLVYGPGQWSDFRASVSIVQGDNDTIGMVFRYVDETNFYLAMLVGPRWGGNRGRYPSAPTGEPAELQGDDSAIILLSVSGSSDNLTVVELGRSALNLEGLIDFEDLLDLDLSDIYRSFRVEAVGEHLQVAIDIDGDGTLALDEIAVDVTDATHSTGTVGLYCYDNGNADALCGFDDLLVEQLDLDDDAIVNDLDNCDEISNVDQLNLDGDGFGDLCDSDVDGDGIDFSLDCNDENALMYPGALDIPNNAIDEDCSGADATEEPDTDDSDGTIEDTEPSESDEDTEGLDPTASSRNWSDTEALTKGVGCSCNMSGAPTGSLLLASSLLFARRRRR